MNDDDDDNNNKAVVFRRMTTQYWANKINVNVAWLLSEEKQRTQALCAQGAILRNIGPATSYLCKTCQHDKYYFYHTDGCEWFVCKMDGNAEGWTWAYLLMIGFIWYSNLWLGRQYNRRGC